METTKKVSKEGHLFFFKLGLKVKKKLTRISWKKAGPLKRRFTKKKTRKKTENFVRKVFCHGKYGGFFEKFLKQKRAKEVKRSGKKVSKEGVLKKADLKVKKRFNENFLEDN